ncbi:MAG: DUF3108 domain-containing protein [Gemmatimonadales bacterium]
MIRRIARCAVALALLPAAWPLARAQRPMPTPVPWAGGEFLEYDVSFGFFHAGSARMEVLGTDTIRGRIAWRLRFNVTGGVWPCRVNDFYDSWLDTETLNSLRFQQNIRECSYKKLRIYEIFPDRQEFIEQAKEPLPGVERPLDDASFFFFLRTIPLEVGKSYEFNRYYDKKANPVVIRVVRKEHLDLPAGPFDAIVLRPEIKGAALFPKDGGAEIWLSDDHRHILLQMNTKLGIGSISLYLKTIRMSPEVAPAPAPRP